LAARRLLGAHREQPSLTVVSRSAIRTLESLPNPGRRTTTAWCVPSAEGLATWFRNSIWDSSRVLAGRGSLQRLQGRRGWRARSEVEAMLPANQGEAQRVPHRQRRPRRTARWRLASASPPAPDRELAWPSPCCFAQGAAAEYVATRRAATITKTECGVLSSIDPRPAQRRRHLQLREIGNRRLRYGSRSSRAGKCSRNTCNAGRRSLVSRSYRSTRLCTSKP